MNKKFIRVLGLGVGLFLAGSLSVNAQKVSFNGERLSLKQAFEKIESVSKYKIAYNTSQLDVNKQVVLNQKNQDVLQILSDLLKGTNCVYQVNDNYIVITLKDDEKVKKIKGTIKDSAGEPIIGANVTLKGDATVGSITDIDGNFDLSVPSNATLQVSYIGYNTQDVPIGNKSFPILKRASYYFIPLKFSDIETVLFLYNFYSCSQSIAYFSKYVYPHGKFTVFHI